MSQQSKSVKKVYVINTQNTVTKKTIKENQFIQCWGDNTAYFLLDNQYIVAGCGQVESYTDDRLKMKLRDDGNGTTGFAWDDRSKKVTVFANHIDDFIKQLPTGGFELYAMK